MTATPKKKSLVRKSPIKGLTNKQLTDVKENLPPTKVIKSFFKDIVNVNKKNESTEPMDKKSFCKYLKVHVSKNELKEICQILNVHYNKDEYEYYTIEEICKTLEKKAPYVMTPRYVSILKVLVTYSAYIVSILVLVALSIRFSNGPIRETCQILLGIDPNKNMNLKTYYYDVKRYFSNYHLGKRTDGPERLQPVLIFLAHMGPVAATINLYMDIVKSRVKHQVFKVLGRDTRKKSDKHRKKTIKKKE